MKKSDPQDLDAEAQSLLSDPRWQRLRAYVDACDNCAGALHEPAGAATKGLWRRVRDWLRKPFHGVGIGTLALAGIVLIVMSKGRDPASEPGQPEGDRGVDRAAPGSLATVTLMCGDRELVQPWRCRVGDELSVSTTDTAGDHDRAVLTLTPGPSGAAVDSVALTVRGRDADLEKPIALTRPGKIQLLVTWTRTTPGAAETRAVRVVEVTP
jgi:hypothetical protein